jgi:hypothetical protein
MVGKFLKSIQSQDTKIIQNYNESECEGVNWSHLVYGRVHRRTGLGGRGVAVRVPGGARFFSSLSRPDRLWGPQPLTRNSVVSIATGYGLDDRGVGVRVPVVTRI